MTRNTINDDEPERDVVRQAERYMAGELSEKTLVKRVGSSGATARIDRHGLVNQNRQPKADSPDT